MPNYRIAAFTGTRRGITPPQNRTVRDILFKYFRIPIIHDGACQGADRNLHALALDVNPGTKFVFWPSNEEQRDWALGVRRAHDNVMEISPPLVRNRFMVRHAQVVIACPSGYVELFRGSGTWATIRYAQEAYKALYVVLPNGTLREENI